MDEDKDDDEGSLSARLRALWRAGAATKFHCLLYKHALPHFCRKLQDLLGLDPTDAEECVSLAFDGFRKTASKGTVVKEPYAYLWTSAYNAGVTIHRQRKTDVANVVDYFSSADRRDPAEIAAARVAAARWAVEAVEETLDDVEADEGWAVTLVDAAMEKLPAQSRSILKYLSEHPFDFARGDLDASSQQAASDLGIKPTAFRKAKERAYARLRKAIPKAAVELRLVLPPRYAETILAERFSVPSEDEE